MKSKPDNAGQCVIYDFSTVQPAGAVAAGAALGQWRLIDWESPLASGKLLWGYMETQTPLTLPFAQRGWHAVSLGLWSPPHMNTRIRVRLSGETDWDELWVRTPSRWIPEGGCQFEEHFWRLADLTGRSLEIAATTSCSGLGFVRLIPLTEPQSRLAQSPERINWLWTNDGHGTFIEERQPPSRAVTDNIAPFAGTDFTDISWSILSTDIVNYNSAVASRLDTTEGPNWRELDKSISRNVARLLAAGDDPNKLAVSDAARHGIRPWLAQRLQLFALEPPYDVAVSDFYRSHRDWACLTRDGRPMAQMSFAYPQVRSYLIDILTELAHYRPFGLHLQFNRGVPCTHFEKPLLDEFARRYGTDMRQCDKLDERVVAVRALYVTAFMRELRQRLNRQGFADMKIGVNCMPNKVLNDEFGLDVAAWAREGLVTRLMPCRWEWRGEIPDNLWQWHNPYEMDFFLNAVNGTACTVHPYAYNGNNHRHALPHEHRARALECIRQGAHGLCGWDPAPSLARLGLGRPGELEVWEQLSKPLPQADIRNLGDVAIDAYSPHYGA